PVRRGLKALEFFELREGERTWLQSCISPVWDTALAVRALAAAGLPPQDPAMVKATSWILSQQIFKPGDWCVKCPDLPPGGWAFEFVNNWYPDVDDSSMVLTALKEGLADSARRQAPIQRGINWCLGMQCKNGGFASFDKDNTKEWLNAIPFGDVKALAFLRRSQHGDGPWWGRWGVNYIYGTWSVLAGLAAIGEDLHRPYVRRAAAWLKES